MFKYLLKINHPDLLLPSPLQISEVMEGVGSVRKFWIKRDDLIHPVLSGNKLRKLLGYIGPLVEEGDITMVTFGGPHSNHLHASGWLCNHLGWNMLAIMPQYINHNHNATFKDLISYGVEIVRVDTQKMKQLKSCGLDTICDRFSLDPNRTLLVPMGGDGPQADLGISEMVKEVEADLPGNKEWIIPVGTGRTAEATMRRAGIDHVYSIYIPFLKQSIRESLLNRFRPFLDLGYRINILSGPTRRYGKLQDGILSFVESFEKETSVKLDPIYNGPAMKYWLQIRPQEGLHPILLHTGGLQGWRGFGGGVIG
jgi:1-aminocyclopropane-1-carboxylate deaminase/D-cysteine desulfhydrase-like pyridoxal-dependent ACC family enzyme